MADCSIQRKLRQLEEGISTRSRAMTIAELSQDIVVKPRGKSRA